MLIFKMQFGLPCWVVKYIANHLYGDFFDNLKELKNMVFIKLNTHVKSYMTMSPQKENIQPQFASSIINYLLKLLKKLIGQLPVAVNHSLLRTMA